MKIQYYSDKLESLREIFQGTDIRLETGRLIVDDHIYPIVDDVIILLDPEYYPQSLRDRLSGNANAPAINTPVFSEDVQFNFGKQWEKFSDILVTEHDIEFHQYFDIVNLDELKDKRVMDLGCGMGRWEFFLKDKCREMVLVDFSEAIFVARHNLKDVKNALFFMGDINKLPFRSGCADLIMSLGVLHHLPIDALDEIRQLKKYSPNLLIYLYYSLDNKPSYHGAILGAVTGLRKQLSKIRNETFRNCFAACAAATMYYPFIWMGKALEPLGLAENIPIYYGHHWMSFNGIQHAAYDRFFTSIEQRFSRKQIESLEESEFKVVVSDQPGYWHFLCYTGDKPSFLRESPSSPDYS